MWFMYILFAFARLHSGNQLDKGHKSLQLNAIDMQMQLQKLQITNTNLSRTNVYHRNAILIFSCNANEERKRLHHCNKINWRKKKKNTHTQHWSTVWRLLIVAACFITITDYITESNWHWLKHYLITRRRNEPVQTERKHQTAKW